MNAIKTTLIILVMGFLLIFAIENTQSFSQVIQLRLNLWIINPSFPLLPLYMLVIIPFLGGILFMAILMKVRNFQWKKKIRDKDKTIKTLQVELNSLRSLSIAKPVEVSQTVPIKPVEASREFKGLEELDTSTRERKPSTLKQMTSWIKEKF